MVSKTIAFSVAFSIERNLYVFCPVHSGISFHINDICDWLTSRPVALWPPSLSHRSGSMADRYGPQTPGTNSGCVLTWEIQTHHTDINSHTPWTHTHTYRNWSLQPCDMRTSHIWQPYETWPVALHRAAGVPSHRPRWPLQQDNEITENITDTITHCYINLNSQISWYLPSWLITVQ